MPAFSPKRLPFLIDVSAQCMRDRGRQQDRRVHARDRDRELVALEREPLVAGHDPDEEVGREEGPEDHDLGDDEEQHPEQLGLDARGAVRRRRPVVRRASCAWAIEAASMTLLTRRPRPRRRTRRARPACWTRARTRSMRSARSQPERVAGSVEMTMSSTRKNCSAFIDRGVGVGVADHARRRSGRRRAARSMHLRQARARLAARRRRRRPPGARRR